MIKHCKLEHGMSHVGVCYACYSLILSSAGDISIITVDPEKEPMALRSAYSGLPKQLIPTSLLGHATLYTATEMPFAAQHTICQKDTTCWM